MAFKSEDGNQTLVGWCLRDIPHPSTGIIIQRFLPRCMDSVDVNSEVGRKNKDDVCIQKMYHSSGRGGQLSIDSA